MPAGLTAAGTAAGLLNRFVADAGSRRGPAGLPGQQEGDATGKQPGC